MDYINIPVELCRYTLTNHKVSQVRLFIYLKTICSGQFKLSDDKIKSICNNLNYKTPKTFKVHFNWLLKQEWITINGKSGYYKIKGFIPLANKLKLKSVRGAIFEPLDFTAFKPFIIAAVITYYMNYRSRNERLSECLTGRPKKYRLSPAFFSLPHLYLAKILNISKSLAATYRNLAINAGFIKVKRRLNKLPIPLIEKNNYKKYFASEKQNIRVINKALYEQLNDELISNVILRTKNNLKKNLKKNGKKLYR
ncbi:MAG: hypothetical protein A2046_07145 [Bacteroidetes bacterium GWA2_30_7]|nr:MAG: hypothetical protein A2046_07145 [Bacteroidetes bacterium GWA2_30_7]